ncbi:MAG: hypothetical protein HZA92_17220 [Verrucomicrobia bacterium]|nr:hypothetical protein [Verrucomicrobiota bacterium]
MKIKASMPLLSQSKRPDIRPLLGRGSVGLLKFFGPNSEAGEPKEHCKASEWMIAFAPFLPRHPAMQTELHSNQRNETP